MAMMFHRLRLINKKQLGFTLVELMIAIAVSGVVTGAITTTIYQVITGNFRTNNHMTAVRQVQEAGYWVSHDVQMIQQEPVIVKNVDDQLESIALTWTDWDGTVNDVTYTLEGTELWRDCNGQRIRVAQFIDPAPEKTQCEFTSGKLIFTVTATVGAGSAQAQSETRVYEIVPRPGS